MQTCGRFPILIGSMLLATAASGCLTLDRYRQLEILMRDAETGKTIPAANVRISYLTDRSSSVPHESSGVSGADGVARVDTVPNAEFCIWLEAKAAGYLTHSRDVCAELVRQCEPDSWFAVKEHRPLRLTVEMYAEPRFCIEWTVPTGFRGLIKAEVRFDDHLPCQPAQRCFRFNVPGSGQLQITVPGLLKRFSPVYRARYEDDTPLSEDMDALKVGFQWLKSDGDYEYFVVGTQVDYERFRRENSVGSSSSEAQYADGGKGRGRGGRRNRGNPSASATP